MTTTLIRPTHIDAPARPAPPHDTAAGPGPTDRSPARWVRPALIALLLATACAYLWDLSASGYANSFYAAAVQAGTKSWKAFFFGSLDSSNFITVDKIPGSLWIMELSARIFGFNSWSMLVPQALEGVAAVGILYATVKRWFGAGAGLLAGAALATTPVAALMFRFNNPDAFMVLLLVAGAYTLTRALESARTRWVVATGALLGFAFLAKELQAFTVLPAFALVYLVAAPTRLRRRVGQLALGLAGLVAGAGWWLAAVALWPTASRPYIDGSPDNNIFNLIFGYNGLSRIDGSSGPNGSGFSGATGVLRLFNDLMGGQAAWLLPAALVALVGGLVLCRRAPRTDRTRAALVLWGGWLLVTGAVFSFGSGIIHTYYTVALAPAIAALVGIGAALAWHHRSSLVARALASVTVLGTAAWSYALLDRTPSYDPWLRYLVLSAGIAAAGLLLAGARLRRVGLGAGAVLALTACLGGPLAYGATTISTPHTGSIPSAGPAIASAGGFGGPGRGGGAPSFGAVRAATSRTARGRSGPPTLGASGRPRGGFGAESGTLPSAGRFGGRLGSGGGIGGAGALGGAGGGAGSVATSKALVAALQSDSGRYRWVAATFGSQSAASIELESGGLPVMAIGGFSGQGGNISLATFESYVAKGEIHYFIASGGGAGGPGGSRANSDALITSWVESHYSAKTIGGVSVYDLTSPK